MVKKPGLGRKNGYVIVFSSLSLFIYLMLFFLRHYDDNRLTSWEDVFTVVNPAEVFFILIICIMAAWQLSKLSLMERYPSFFLFGASFISAAFFWHQPEIIVDASRYFTQAKHFELYGAGFFLKEWGRTISAWTDLPVVPFLYGLIFKIFGENRIYIQIFTTLLFSSSILLTYGIGKKIWDADTGFYAALLLLGIPYLFTQVPLVLVDVPAMFFLLLAIFSFLHAIEKGEALRIGFSSIVITLAFYSKYSMWMMLSVLIIFAITYRNSMHELRTSVYLYRTFGIFLVSAFFIGIIFVYKYDSISEQIRMLLSYQRPGLQRWGESFVSTFFFQIHPLITFSAAYSAYAAWRKKDFRYLAVLWLVALVVFFQIRRIRYIIMVFPMLTLMASYGLQQIRQKEIIRFISLSVVIFSFVIAVFAYLPFLKKNSASNIVNAGKYLNSLKVTTAEVVVIPSETSVVNPAVSVPILDYLTGTQLSYAYDKTTPQLTEKILISPLRFSWEYKNPQYYKTADMDSAAVVVISDGVAGKLPEKVRQMIARCDKSVFFHHTDNIYEYQPVVSIYY